MKKIICFLFTALFLCYSNPNKAQTHKRRYLVASSGLRVDIDSFNYVTADTLFFVSHSQQEFIPLDSIAEYHFLQKPRSKGAGGLIGLSLGALIGGCIGAITYEKPQQTSGFDISGPDFGPWANIGAGALAGIAGYFIWRAASGGPEKDTTIDLKNNSRYEKSIFFQEEFTSSGQPHAFNFKTE